MSEDRDAYQCSHHCFQQTLACLKVARLRFSPARRKND